MMHGDFSKQLGFLQLRLENVLLRSHARAVAGVSGLFHLPEQLAVFFEDSECFGEIRELEICTLDFSEDGAANGLDLLLRNICVAFRNLTLQTQLTRVRKVLRNAEAEIGKVAVGVTREWARTANADVLQIELRVGQRRDLCWNLLRRLPSLPRRFNLRIVLLRFREQLREWSDRSRVRYWRFLRKSMCG